MQEFSCIPTSQPRLLVVMLLMKCLRVIEMERKHNPHHVVGDCYMLGNSALHKEGADWASHPGWDFRMRKAELGWGGGIGGSATMVWSPH